MSKILIDKEVVEQALEALETVLQDAYHRRFPECCGRPGPECCGNPIEAFSKEDNAIMDALSPVQRQLSETLRAALEQRQEPVQGPLQAGLTNSELIAQWHKKLPGAEPKDRDLQAFAVGAEVGFSHARELERQDWSRAWHAIKRAGVHPGRTDDRIETVIDRLASERDALRAALEQRQEPSQAPCSVAEDGVCEALECCQRQEPVQEPENIKAAFEAWVKADSTLPITRDEHGYTDFTTALLWHAWQAAKTNAPEGASEGESSANAGLGLAGRDDTYKHDFAIAPRSGIPICTKCGLSETAARKQRQEPVQEPHNLINLPILPEPAWNERVYGGHGNEITHHWYSDHQMREYARQAVHEAEDAWQSRHPAPQSVELTDEDIAKAWATTKGDVLYRIRPFARAVIAAYQAKQEGKV